MLPMGLDERVQRKVVMAVMHPYHSTVLRSSKMVW